MNGIQLMMRSFGLDPESVSKIQEVVQGAANSIGAIEAAVKCIEAKVDAALEKLKQLEVDTGSYPDIAVDAATVTSTNAHRNGVA